MTCSLETPLGSRNSNVVPITIGPPVATPTFTPAAGTYAGAQNITIASATSGATVLFTDDGTDPLIFGTPVSGPVTVPVGDTTLRAIGIKAGMQDSLEASASYIIETQVAMPTFAPAAGTYVGAQNVTISTTTAGATVLFTADGSDPLTFGTPVTGSVSVTGSSTLRAIGIKAGMANSTEASAAYIIETQVAMPTFSPPAGTYTGAQNVTISTATAGATLLFTADGSDPLIFGSPVTGPVVVSSSSTLRAIGIKAGMANSTEASASYVLTLPPSYDATVLADSPVAYFKMSETSGATAADSGPNSFAPGTYGSGATTGNTPIASGLGDSALMTGGLNTFLDIPRNSLINFTSGDFSIECWVILTNNSGNQQFFCFFDGANGYRLLLLGGPFTVSINNSRPVSSVTAPSGANLGKPFHVVLTFDSATGTYKIYVNGTLEGSSSPGQSNPSLTSGTDLFIGNLSPAIANLPWIGSMSNIALYASELSSTRVAAHFAAGI
jgi:Concanavalin A-like lectin/glucanases superfamily/Chitobiase/beta-hexosaminidase C-terminal domain